MGPKFSKQAYAELLNLMNRQYFCERPAKEDDSSFLQYDQWLRDSAVIEQVIHSKEGWEIYLVFAYSAFPYRLIRRYIDVINHPNKAFLNAVYMRRLAAKDQRGTQQVNLQDFALCTN